MYSAIKRILEIPEDEPIFIIRGKDKLATESVDDYLALAAARGCNSTFLKDLESVVSDFERFQARNPDVVKLPD
jgi:hypothetical protein